MTFYGGLAQLGERLPYKQRVTGSSPVSSILLSDSAELFNIWLMMAVVAKWLTHRIVAPARVGSIPTYRPLLGYSQAVRQRFLVPSCTGSNPVTPIIYRFETRVL